MLSLEDYKTWFGEKDLILKLKLSREMKLANYLDKNAEYSVPFGQSDIPVNIHLAIPSTVSCWHKFNINIRFLDTTPSENTGTVSLSSSTSIRIPVVVVEKAASHLLIILLRYCARAEKNTGKCFMGFNWNNTYYCNNNCCLPYS